MKNQLKNNVLLLALTASFAVGISMPARADVQILGPGASGTCDQNSYGTQFFCSAGTDTNTPPPPPVVVHVREVIVPDASACINAIPANTDPQSFDTRVQSCISSKNTGHLDGCMSTSVESTRENAQCTANGLKKTWTSINGHPDWIADLRSACSETTYSCQY